MTIADAVVSKFPGVRQKRMVSVLGARSTSPERPEGSSDSVWVLLAGRMTVAAH